MLFRAKSSPRREIRGAVVVITGASSGIGRATAIAFARKGAALVLAAREAEPLEEVADACQRESHNRAARPLVVPTDVRDVVSVEMLGEAAIEAYGRIDVWVNDAGVYLLGTVEETPIQAVRELFETNVMGVLHGAREAVERFRERPEGGVLINVGSVAGKVAYAKASAYCASKHAVHAISEALRQELVGTPIDVCVVAPPTVDTPLFQHAANFTGRRIVPMRPVISPEEVANAIVRCAEHPEAEVLVGAAPKLMVLAARLLPGIFERFQPEMVEREHLAEESEAPHLGNIADAVEPHAITGGWMRAPDLAGGTPSGSGAN